MGAVAVWAAAVWWACAVGSSGGGAGQCPALCECKWRGGKEAALCAAAGLARLPDALPHGTQLLDASLNALRRVPPRAFAAAGLLNLQRLYLRECQLLSLPDTAFDGLINLVDLDLSHNLLKAVPTAALSEVPALRELRLSHNPLNSFPERAFGGLPGLVRLDLAACQIATLPPLAFHGPHDTLEWLKLDDNYLQVLDVAVVEPLSRLHGLELAGNPWLCDCQLRPLRQWQIQRNMPVVSGDGALPSCDRPSRLNGRTWPSLDAGDWSCAPRVLAAAAGGAASGAGRATAAEGSRVALECRVRGGASHDERSTRWLRAGREIRNTSRMALLYQAGQDDDSYSLVLSISAVEAADGGVYVCRAENRAGRGEAALALGVRRDGGGDAGSGGRGAAWGAALAALLASAALAVALITRRAARRDKRPAPPDAYEKIELAPAPPRYGPVSLSADTDDDEPIAAVPCRRSMYLATPDHKDLHIPTMEQYIADLRADITPDSVPSSSSNGNNNRVDINHHVAPVRPSNMERILNRGIDRYSTERLDNDLSGSDENNVPDLLELTGNCNTERYIEFPSKPNYFKDSVHNHKRSNEEEYSFSTLPNRKKRKSSDTHDYRSSTDSQSPLLSEAVYSRVVDEIARRNTHISNSYLNLTSPETMRSMGGRAYWSSGNAATPLLNVTELQQSAAQLDRFLQEYRALHDRLLPPARLYRP